MNIVFFKTIIFTTVTVTFCESFTNKIQNEYDQNSS